MRAITLGTTQLKQILKQPVSWVVLFVMPIALVGFLLYGLEHIIKTESLLPPFDVAIVDDDNTKETKILIQQFQDDDELSELITFRNMDEEKAQSLLEANKIAAILKVPEGFTDGIRYGENKPVTVIGNEQRPFQASLFLEMMKSAADLVSAAQSGVNTIYDYMVEIGYSEDYINRVANETITDFTLFAFGRQNMFEKEKVESLQGVEPLEYYSISGFLFLLLFTGLLTMSLITSSNRQVDERLRTFGVSAGSHVVSTFLTQAVILMMQALIILGSLWILTDLKITGHLGWSTLTTLCAVLIISIWYTFLSNLPLGEGIRFFVAFVFLVIFTTLGSLSLPESYFTGILEWVNLSTLSHWIHSLLVHSFFIENEEILFACLGVLGGMGGIMLFSAFLLRQVKQA
ncbi:ABC transporter permease [Pseudalkalibacillus sp. Hm43]|uniref:ABC transporter permease n=1 Tax=Pseudalkalibacillus sp. Hm43 TaxID=3450742 RepID=UPI003F41BDF0